ncbi:MAG: ABC transporter ATP-binding protein [Phyllobacterium sp.]
MKAKTPRQKINPDDAKRIIKRVFSENFRDYYKSYILAVIAMLVVSATTAFIPWIFRDVIDQIFVNQRADLLFLISAAVCGAFVLRGFAGYFQSVLLSKIGNNLVARYQRRIFDHLMRLGLDFYNDRRSAYLAAQINQNVGGVRDLLNVTITAVARDIVSMVGLIGVMIAVDPWLSLIALLIGPPLILAVRYLSRRLRSIHRESVDLNARLLGAMQEATQGIAIVKAFTMEDQLRDKISTLIIKAEGRANKIARVSERTTPISEILAGVAIAAMIAFSGYRAIHEQQPPGAMFAFITALLLAYDPARRLARTQVNLEKSLVNARMIYEILDIPPKQEDAPGAATIHVEHGEVRFDTVSFDYQKNVPILRSISFTAASGKTTALVGASGAGKSTVISLIQRFYDVTEGKILIDGQDIAGVTKASLRHSIAYVSQAPYLFEGSIGDNIRYGRPDATDEEIRTAARLAHAEEFILRLPQGYDTPLGENGATLSGGQRQRLSIARALVRNAPILLLDEATSALDNESERLVQQALDEVMRDRTTIVVAHRLSTVVNADQIIVMEAGRIIEEGSHGDLIGIPNGAYARFHQLQTSEAEAASGEPSAQNSGIEISDRQAEIKS